MLASDVYSYLSGSAHSIFLSVLQSVETQVNMQQEEAIRTSMVIMNRVIANMVIEYCRLFPRARNVLSTDHEGLEIVDWWFQVDRGLDEFTNIGQEND